MMLSYGVNRALKYCLGYTFKWIREARYINISLLSEISIRHRVTTTPYDCPNVACNFANFTKSIGANCKINHKSSCK